MTVGTPTTASCCMRSTARTSDVAVQPSVVTMPLRASTDTARPSAGRSTKRPAHPGSWRSAGWRSPRPGGSAPRGPPASRIGRGSAPREPPVSRIARGSAPQGPPVHGIREGAQEPQPVRPRLLRMELHAEHVLVARDSDALAAVLDRSEDDVPLRLGHEAVDEVEVIAVVDLAKPRVTPAQPDAAPADLRQPLGAPHLRHRATEEAETVGPPG